MPAAATQEVAPPASITIGSTKVPMIKINEPIVIEEPTTEAMNEVPMGATTNNQEVKSIKRDSKYCQPKWCPPGLSKTKRRKLQRARHHKQKIEMMEKMRKDIFNYTHQFFPPLGRKALQDILVAIGTWQTDQAGSAAQLPNQIGQASSATGSTPQISQASLELARPVPLPPVQADTSSGDSAPDFVAPIVATESEDLQED
jgi:hypothetical protein